MTSQTTPRSPGQNNGPARTARAQIGTSGVSHLPGGRGHPHSTTRGCQTTIVLREVVVRAPIASLGRRLLRLLKLIGLAIVLAAGLAACSQDDPTTYNQGYTYGYDNWNPNNFAYYQACNDRQDEATNSSWQDGCTAGTNDAMNHKGYHP